MLERKDGAPPAGISGLDPMLLRDPPDDQHFIRPTGEP
jgi:hypothetical protein